MSRSGYIDDMDDPLAHGRWRAAVNSAIKGRRGQVFFKELLAALDAMPEKRLIANHLQADGAFCTLGVLGHARGIDMSTLDPEDPREVSAAFGIARALAQEVVYMNDEWDYYEEPPERRWQRMREWVVEQIADQSLAQPRESRRKIKKSEEQQQ